MTNVLLVDFGSTFTKVTYVDFKTETMLSAQSYSTVDSDIKIGYQKALELLKEKANKPLTFDKIIACSSAAGGLKMAAIGLVPELTVEAAKRACMGAGAKVDLVFSHKLIQADLKRIKEKDIDIILLSGGTDGGHQESIMHNAKMLYDSDLDIPIIYAGNRDLQDEIKTLFSSKSEMLYVCDNVMKKINQLSFDSAKQAIREVFLKRIVMAKGIKSIESEIDEIISPTPESVLNAATLLSLGTDEEAGLGELMLVDIGGATTDIYSMAYGTPKRVEIVMKGLEEPYSKRTVEGDFGMRYSAIGVVDSFSEKERNTYLKENIDLVHEAQKRHDNPDYLPISHKDEMIDFILAKQAVKESVKRHVGHIEPYYTSMGMMYYQTGKNLHDVDLVIGTGGVIINSQKKWQILEETVSESELDLRPKKPKFAIDEDYILSAMGLLATIDKNLALRLMKKHIKMRDEHDT